MRPQLRWLLVPLAFIWLFVILRSFKPTLVRDAGYVLRPIWDTPPDTFDTIAHYKFDPDDVPNSCALHNWKPYKPKLANKRRKRKVVDVLLFSVEIDLAIIRLQELWDVVDHFIVIEGNRTFTGDYKPLTFAENRHRFAFAESKIIYEETTTLLENPHDPFDNEKKSRDHATDIIKTLNLEESDIVIISDVDEIPTRHTIALLKACQGYPQYLHLEMKSYMYSFEFPVPHSQWRPMVGQIGAGGSIEYDHRRMGDIILAGSGVHCSWCLRSIQDFQFKMQAYSHADRAKAGNRVTDPANIQKAICEGSNVEQILPEVFTFRDMAKEFGNLEKSFDMTTIPKPVVDGQRQWPYLLRGGCIRQDSPTKSLP
ncbi:Beta-1,4-mannosyl-glycoprotein 4-beta-N-acetylglucosaminyltransferase [Drechslerella dactyloides]|uniref:Beta-1,4-mannosyl-glycoprotein 4-beta-N-acetylglucosaminyltransferase n=1 Tax=Drechslerella dactyloides TaxID=74499 RepID=A0AAD6IXB1_DREDA|nr:Beta-1,4-mannosyl-glycoprotein 4-beta-N-acetylglucosaminyltransferase [Drechslerella dactyloides]